MSRFLTLLTCLMIVGFSVRAMGEPAFEHGVRPASSLYDPERSLSSELADHLIVELEKANKRDQADVMVVLLPTVGELPPEHVARRFSEAWGNRLLNAVILDVAGRNDGPWIHVGGDLAFNDRDGYLPQRVRDALRLARQEPDRESCLRSATAQTADLLRFVRGRAQSQGEAYLTEQFKARLETERKARMGKILLYGAAASVIPFFGFIALCVMFYLRRRPRHFPPVLWSRRLGAPHGGGNDAVVDLGRSSRS